MNNIVPRLKLEKNSCKLSLSGPCPTCHMNVPEDTYHILVECSGYNDIKKKYFGEGEHDLSEWITILESSSFEEIGNFYNLVRGIMARRERDTSG